MPAGHEPFAAALLQLNPGIFNLSQVIVPEVIFVFVIALVASVEFVIAPL